MDQQPKMTWLQKIGWLLTWLPGKLLGTDKINKQ